MQTAHFKFGEKKRDFLRRSGKLLSFYRYRRNQNIKIIIGGDDKSGLEAIYRPKIGKKN